MEIEPVLEGDQLVVREYSDRSNFLELPFPSMQLRIFLVKNLGPQKYAPSNSIKSTFVVIPLLSDECRECNINLSNISDVPYLPCQEVAESVEVVYMCAWKKCICISEF